MAHEGNVFGTKCTLFSFRQYSAALAKFRIYPGLWIVAWILKSRSGANPDSESTFNFKFIRA
jgi:hypothetical protein